MSSVAAYLNDLPELEARTALARCCGSGAWVEAMMRHRPFGSDDTLFDLAEKTWRDLSRDDWLEAFSAHPRIGERASMSPSHASTSSWSREEQSGMEAADASVETALHAGNVEYERRFGHVFLICATGRSADEMLQALNERLNNDSDTELRVAAEQHVMITRLRLKRLGEVT